MILPRLYANEESISDIILSSFQKQLLKLNKATINFIHFLQKHTFTRWFDFSRIYKQNNILNKILFFLIIVIGIIIMIWAVKYLNIIKFVQLFYLCISLM